MELMIIQRKSTNEPTCKATYRTERPVVCRLWIKPQTCDFHDFFSYYVAVGSFTADGGLLQTDGVCKDNTSQDHFRSVNLYKEFAYRSEFE